MNIHAEGEGLCGHAQEPYARTYSARCPNRELFLPAPRWSRHPVRHLTRASVAFNPLILCDSLLVGEHRIGGQIRYLGEVPVECKCVTRKDCAPRLTQFSGGPDRRKTRPRM